MINSIKKYALVLMASASLMAFSTASSAHCRWVHGHYSAGAWVPAHKVCWHRGDRMHHCRWHHGHRVCW